jgi:division protein CdvB (Snf7/Vps24/ESCRT-III family)
MKKKPGPKLDPLDPLDALAMRLDAFGARLDARLDEFLERLDALDAKRHQVFLQQLAVVEKKLASKPPKYATGRHLVSPEAAKILDELAKRPGRRASKRGK